MNKMIDTVYTNNELYHHGIKGQKWGVRRYQNDDGSVTSAGAKRYYENGGKSKSSSSGNSKKSGNAITNAAHKVAAANYDLNAKFYTKTGNKALASMNKQAANSERKKIVETNKKQLTDEEKAARAKKIKTAVGIGMAAAGTAMAVYGAKKYSDISKAQSDAVKASIDAGHKAAQNATKSFAAMSGAEKRSTITEAGKVAVANGWQPTNRTSNIGAPVADYNDMLDFAKHLI